MTTHFTDAQAIVDRYNGVNQVGRVNFHLSYREAFKQLTDVRDEAIKERKRKDTLQALLDEIKEI